MTNMTNMTKQHDKHDKIHIKDDNSPKKKLWHANCKNNFVENFERNTFFVS